jgi:hypothetical protein
MGGEGCFVAVVSPLPFLWALFFEHLRASYSSESFFLLDFAAK